MKRYIFIVGGPMTLVVIWWFFSLLNSTLKEPIISPLFITDPLSVFKATFYLFAKENFAADVFSTLERVLWGFLIGAAIGVPAGIVIGYFKRLGESLEFVIDFFRSLPAAALFPFFIMVFGVGDFSKIGVAALSSSLIILVNTIYGVHSVKELRIMAAKLFRLSNTAIFTKIVLPESLPHIFAGLRVAISYSMILVVFTEMFIGTESGLGKRIINSQETYSTAEMFSAILIAGILGYVINKLLLLVERRLIRWEGKS